MELLKTYQREQALEIEFQVATIFRGSIKPPYLSFQESAFYFCTVTSGSFQTSSHGAYLTVAYLNDFAEDGGPSDKIYDEAGLLLIELQCQVSS